MGKEKAIQIAQVILHTFCPDQLQKQATLLDAIQQKSIPVQQGRTVFILQFISSLLRDSFSPVNRLR